MAEKVTKTMKVAASGMLDIEDNDIYIEVEDVGIFSLKKLLQQFNGCGVKLSCTYDQEQLEPETENKDFDEIL